ncbi:unnamed protein product [Prorocentrum cordatum]|uniref:Uncharacterized protein n=1 Tax=Prorocentrum cordatum TaxID=2364126 RepID=A0ABN9W2D4_9DINO|nr:unnamed protein product [Polarella glacialis]
MAVQSVLAAGLLAAASALGANATKTRSGSCDCLSFADVYYTEKAWCGRANELYFLSKNGFSASYAATEPITGLPHKVCADMFKNFNHGACLNIDLYPFPEDEKSGKQWCYVSNDCADLNGGGYATNAEGFAQSSWHNLQTASFQQWKICDPTEANTEAMMVKPVTTVVEIGKASDVPLSRLLRLSYPAVNISWGEAKFLWDAINEEYAADRTITEMVDAIPPISGWGSEIEGAHARLREIAKSEQGTILDSPGHGDNFHVVQGRAAYAVTRTPLGNMAYLGGHFSKEYDVTCLVGCAEPEARDAVDLETM